MNKIIVISLSALLAACDASVSSGLLAGIKAVPLAETETAALGGATAPDAEVQTKGFRNTEGDYIELQRGLLNLVPVSLERCESAWQRLSPLASAHAHGGHDGSAAAGVVDVNRPDGTEFDLGALAPSPGTYCGLRVALQPVVREPADVAIRLQGTSVYVAPCTYRNLGLPGVPGLPVDPASVAEEGCLEAILLPARREFVVPISPALTMDASDRIGGLTVAIAYDRWFDGVDVSALPADAEQQARMIDNIVTSMTARAP